MSFINGVDVDEVQGFSQRVAEDAAGARVDARVTARWLAGDASLIECAPSKLQLGGQGNMNPMQALLASLAACEVDVIATHAALLGLHIDELELEATGGFDLRSYLGLEAAPGSGYEEVRYMVRLRAPTATPEQLDYLRERCQTSSPVCDTLVRPVRVRMQWDAM